MPIIKLLCNYCNHIWKDIFVDEEELVKYSAFLQCPRCKDKSIKIIKPKDVFGYQKKEYRNS